MGGGGYSEMLLAKYSLHLLNVRKVYLTASYLEEVLHTLRIVTVALSADSLHLLDLACFAGCLDILEVDLWILAEVHNGTQEVE